VISLCVAAQRGQEVLRKDDYVLVPAIVVALIALFVSYAAHVEYFKAFFVVFGVAFSLFVLRSHIPPGKS
jgi:hypothetical protein